MCSTYDIENKKNNKALKIAEFLIENKIGNVCLVIQGAWGVGKTYLWKEVAEKIKEKNQEKQVVYIDLFGKESYKQILEEIVLKVNGTHNKVLEKVAKLTSGAIKLAGVVNISLDSIFSIFKKEDFANIIVCFDNIERRADKLPLDEILGLVNLLKEDKSCNVVMIFNKDELDKQELNNQKEREGNNKSKSSNNKVSPKSWYEIHKEKVIDYEIVIDNNGEIAREIIEENLECDIKEIKQDIVNLILECFKQKLNNNLRLLIKITQHINYFNKECFMQFYNYKEREIFIDTLRIHYRALFDEVMKYYSIKSDDENGIVFPCYKKYFDDLLHLNGKDVKKICDTFQRTQKDKLIPALEQYKQEYTFGNLGDNKIAEYIEELLPKIENYPYNGTFYHISYYNFFIELYKGIKGKDLPCEEKIMKQFIEILVLEEKGNNPYIQQSRANLRDYFESIEYMIEKNPQYKDYYEQLKKGNNFKEDIKDFVNNYPIKNIKNSFYVNNIKKYNNFEKDSIVNLFQENNQFYKEFFLFFSILEYSNSNYDLDDRLFQSYKSFLDADDNKFKKNTIKKLLCDKQDCLLYKLL